MNTVTLNYGSKDVVQSLSELGRMMSWTEADRKYLDSKKSIARLESFQYKNFPVRLIMNIMIDHKAGGKETNSAVKDAITFNFRNNVSALYKCVLTPWMAMHRVFHMVQADPGFADVRSRRDSRDQVLVALREFDIAFRMLGEAYGLDYAKDKQFWNILRSSFPYNENNSYLHCGLWNELLYSICTFRSARKRMMSFSVEVAPELFAQYTVTGSIKFNPLPDTLSTKDQAPPMRMNPDYVEILTVDRKHDVDMEQVAALIESAFDKLIALMPGKQLSF